MFGTVLEVEILLKHFPLTLTSALYFSADSLFFALISIKSVFLKQLIITVGLTTFQEAARKS
jgi:hypothetical protein